MTNFFEEREEIVGVYATERVALREAGFDLGKRLCVFFFDESGRVFGIGVLMKKGHDFIEPECKNYNSDVLN